MRDLHADRDRILAALKAEDVAAHLGITAPWRGRWLRSSRCPVTDHNGDAFAMSRDGKIHCHSCDFGGDLLLAIALGEGLNIKADFRRVLEIAGDIAGEPLVEDPFGGGPTKPAPPVREPVPQLKPLPERVNLARRRAAWIWERLFTIEEFPMPGAYLEKRGLDPKIVLAREELKSTPLRIPKELREQIDRKDPTVSQELMSMWWTMGTSPGTQSVVIPVRHVLDGSLVDLRSRRIEPQPGKNKIVGMVGGVTVSSGERGRQRQLIGCYGRPHDIDSDHVIVVEGAGDYLTGLSLFPNCQIVGAVDAGSFALLASHVARELKGRGSEGKMTLVEQDDPPRLSKAGEIIPGAADQAVNEQPNAATKVAIETLGMARVGWLFCDAANCVAAGGSPTIDDHPVKDLNDVFRAGANVKAMFRWWREPSDVT